MGTHANPVEQLADHLNQVEGSLADARAAATPDGLIHAPSLAAGVAALFREKRETIAALNVARANARRGTRRGDAA